MKNPIRILLMTLALVVCTNTAVLNWQMLSVENKIKWTSARTDIAEQKILVMDDMLTPASSTLEEVMPAAVMISIQTGVFNVLTGEMVSFSASGVVIDSSGVILTCKHVVEHLGEKGVGSVILDDGQELIISKVVVDPNLDIAVCKVEVDPNTLLKALPVSEVLDLKVGDTVYVIGNPVGLEFSVSQGVVSSIRELDKNGANIQTDAAINPGSSGGPIVNQEGGLVGIAESIITPGDFNIGLGFGIGVNQISRCLPRLLEELNK